VRAALKSGRRYVAAIVDDNLNLLDWWDAHDEGELKYKLGTMYEAAKNQARREPLYKVVVEVKELA
jgi:hypothetical protein